MPEFFRKRPKLVWGVTIALAVILVGLIIAVLVTGGI
jgi:type IV secretory pathway VirB3-like protein